jgi:hypothetical protein
LVVLEAKRFVPRLAGECTRSVSFMTALRKVMRPRSSHATALERLWKGGGVRKTRAGIGALCLMINASACK